MTRTGRPSGTATQAARIFRVWRLLGDWQRLVDLAAETGVHVRTIRRDLKVIEAVAPLEWNAPWLRRADAGREKDALDAACAQAATAERKVCAGIAATLLAEVEPAATKAPESHAAGEASAARRIFNAITARGAA